MKKRTNILYSPTRGIIMIVVVIMIMIMNVTSRFPTKEEREKQAKLKLYNERADQAFQLYEEEVIEPFMVRMREETGLEDLTATFRRATSQYRGIGLYSYNESSQSLDANTECLGFNSNMIHQYYRDNSDGQWTNQDTEDLRDDPLYQIMETLLTGVYHLEYKSFQFEDMEVVVHSPYGNPTHYINVYAKDYDCTYHLEEDRGNEKITISLDKYYNYKGYTYYTPTPSPRPTINTQPFLTYTPPSPKRSYSYGSSGQSSSSRNEDDADDYASEYADEYEDEYDDWEDAYDDGWDEYWDD